MLMPHDWPEAAKRLVLAGAAVLVILAYALLCLGSAFLAAALLWQVGL